MEEVMRKTAKSLIMAAILLLVVTGTSQAKTLVVGCDFSFKPFVFKGPDGKYTGFDIELWDAIAKRLKLNYKLLPMHFNELIPALLIKKIDVAFAGITINSERESQIDFSYPYFDAGLLTVVRYNNKTINHIGDLVDKIVATKQATTSAEFVSNIQTQKVKLFPTIKEAYTELISGRADAVIFDSPSLMNFVANDGRGVVKIVGRLHKKQNYGFAFPPGSELEEQVSIVTLKLIEDGFYHIIFRKWFGYIP
jgi:glutamine transport system substrate-binding protein